MWGKGFLSNRITVLVAAVVMVITVLYTAYNVPVTDTLDIGDGSGILICHITDASILIFPEQEKERTASIGNAATLFERMGLSISVRRILTAALTLFVLFILNRYVFFVGRAFLHIRYGSDIITEFKHRSDGMK